MSRTTTTTLALGAVFVIVVGAAITVAVCSATFDDRTTAVVASVVLLSGPAWATTFALVSAEDDFARADRARADWLRVLPWTFLIAPLVVPNLLLLTAFLRDSRADGGRSWLTWDRMRPGEGEHDGR